MTSAPAESSSAKTALQTDWRLFRLLFPYAKRNRSLLIVAVLLLIPITIVESVRPAILGQAVALVKGESVAWFLMGRSLASGSQILISLLLITVLIQLAFGGLQGFLVQKVGQRITASIRNDLFDHVTSLSTRFFDRTPVGRLITRLTSDVDALGDVFSTGTIGVLSDLLTIFVTTIFMFLQQWQLALIVLLFLLPITWVIVYLQQQYRRSNYRSREELSALNATLQENITGINVVQLFRREQFNANLFRTINQRYITAVDRTIFYDSAVSATLEWVSVAAIAGVLWMGSLLVVGKSLEFGTLTAFIFYAQQTFQPLRQFAERFTSIQAGLTSLERISDILNEPIEVRDPIQHFASPDRPQPDLPGEIRFENVSFGYKPDDYVLRQLNFTIRPGEKVALVGPTGAGKSSIIRLLCRLYDVSEGRILLNNVDIRDLPQAELRRQMAVILQDGFLFAGDVKANIALGEPYGIETIRQAAEKTNVATFIEQLPQGYDTELRQRGTNLSGGEKQLLAFARAAIRNPGILVLDEATANLDVRTEASIQSALETLLVDRTAIIIAHRLSTIRSVDRILVLKQGQLIETGSHEELLAEDGLYAKLYRLQMLED
jgi:ATP-binding cassette, subfamily B, multidrug efflux pump